MFLYTIFDKVASEFGPVFEAKNDSVALRNFRDLLKRVDNRSDFRMESIGSFDHETGEFVVIPLDKRFRYEGHEVDNYIVKEEFAV